MSNLIDIKKFFSLLHIDILRQIAYKHNEIVSIKHPSMMRKAELINELTRFYSNLHGTELVPYAPKGLDMNVNDIPMEYRPKREIQGDDMKKWAQNFIKVGKNKKQISEEKRASKYLDATALEKAIKQRNQALERARLLRKLKTQEAKSKSQIKLEEKVEAKPQAKQQAKPQAKPQPKEKYDLPIQREAYKKLLDLKKLKKLQNSPRNFKIYDNVNEFNSNIKKIINALPADEKKKLDDNQREVLDDIMQEIDDLLNELEPKFWEE